MTEGSGDNPASDLSSLCQPITLGTEGTAQLVRSVQSGTSEIRHLLLNECDIVYECKVCRSLFRGLPNFIAHKRVYCTELHRSNRLHFIDDKPEDETIVVQPTASAAGSAQITDKKKVETDVPQGEDARKESGPIVREQTTMSDVDVVPGTTTEVVTTQSCYTAISVASAMPHKGGSTVKPYEFYTQAARRVSRKRLKKRTNFLRLESVASNKNAVFQMNAFDVEVDSPLALFQPTQAHTPDETKTSIITVLPEDATGYIHMNLRKRTSSTEVVPPPDVPEQKVVPKVTTEDRAMTTTNKASRVYAENSAKAQKAAVHTCMNLRKRYTRKALTPTAQKLSLFSGCNVKELKCLKCNTKYLTPKTLRYHMSNAHAERRHFFPCLYCGRTFSQLWGTTRHLRLIHHKTDMQVEKLRPKLKKLAYSKSVEELWTEMDVQQTHPVMTVTHQSTPPPDCSSSKRCKVSMMPSHMRPASKQHCNENVVATGKDSARPSQIVFSSAFSLHVCARCKQVFGRKNLLDSHVSTCHLNSGPPKALIPPTKKGRPVSSTLFKQPAATTTVAPIRTSPTPTVTNDNPLVGISESDLARICTMVDDTKLVCLKCHRHYGTTSNLHRHAVRHLGWRRFKCKLCRYTAYNRSECTSHLHRVHTANVVTHTKAEIENLILDLEPEKMKRERPALSRVDLRTIRGVMTFPTQCSTSSLTKSSYNISTRRHARIFNTKPYGWPKLNTAVLCTRSGVYRKPVFSVAASRSNSNSPTEDGDRKDDAIILVEDGMAGHGLNKCAGIEKESNGDDAADKGCVAAGRNSSPDTVQCQPGSNNCAGESTECTTKKRSATSVCKVSMSTRDCTATGTHCTTKGTRCENKSKASTTETIICPAVRVNCVLNDKDCVSGNGDHTAETKECPIKTKECATEK